MNIYGFNNQKQNSTLFSLIEIKTNSLLSSFPSDKIIWEEIFSWWKNLLRIGDHEDVELTAFQYNDSHQQDIGNDIDPDNNVFTGINYSCHYYTDDQH